MPTTVGWTAGTVHQDVDVYAGRLAAGGSVKHMLHGKRIGWLQVARAEVELNGLHLGTGDGAAVEQEAELLIHASAAAEILLFDMTT